MASFVWRWVEGRWTLTIICKVTYKLQPTVSPLAGDQEDIYTEDVHWADDKRNTLRAPSDLVPFKRRVDVLVTGHAYAPQGHPSYAVLARLVAGPVNKAIAVFGDRSFLPNGEPSQPAEFKTMPLCWERSGGGPGTSNPAGMAPPAFGSSAGRSPVPNFQQPGYVANACSPMAPVGMGPISPAWPDRVQKLGRAAAFWDHGNWHAQPLPGAIDAGYFNSAPLDQQADRMAPDEHIELENLHREHPRLVTRLEGVVPRAVVCTPQQPDRRVDLRCDTLWIDTDRGIGCVTWRGSIPLEAAQGAEIHITAHRGGADASTDDIGVWRGESKLASSVDQSGAFAGGSVADSDLETTLVGSRAPAQASPLPFVPASSGGSPSVIAPVEGRDWSSLAGADPSGTIVAPAVARTKDLPFSSLGAQTALPTEPSATEPPPAMLEPITAAFEPAVPSESTARPQTPPPPAMLGPIAPVPATAPEPAPATASTDHASAQPAPPVEPAVPVVDPEAFPIERWAEVSAELDKALRSRTKVLDARKWSEREYVAVERLWKAALDREAATCGFALRFKHDAAYVGALERLRGRPLSASEYARILSATERRQVPAVLEDLEMPPAAHLPIVRLWTAKLARDPKLSFEMIQAVAALRDGGTVPAPATS